MLPCMTSIIDDHLKNKNVEVLEWKGRCIEMDVQGGQLAQQKDFDVLVNSTSYNLVLDSGFISKSILKAAGPEIQAECKQKYKGGIHIGKLAITKGYGLQCKHVFHGCLPKYTTNEDIKSLRIMVRKCLETADDLNMESIAFPALGTGNLGYNRKDVANIIYEEVEKYEKVAIAGSLCRVCCVIFQDDLDTVTEFQKRQLQWMENHKSERSQEEVVVTTDDPQVFRDICLEVQQLQSTKVKEPPKSEISESERLGESPGKRDEEGDSNSKHFKKSSKKFEPLSDERRCLLLRTKENSKKESLVESEVKKDFENLTENIVCPFQDLKQALLQFSSTKGAEEMLQNEKMKKKYELQQFPSQAVVDLKAVVSQKMVQLMVKKGVTADIIRKNSGVIVEQKDPQSMVLSGNILEIKAAFDFLSTLLKKQEMEPKELNTGQRDEHLNIEVEKILPETENSVLQESGAREFPKEQADILPEHLQQFGTSNKTLSQVSFTPSMTMSTPSQGYQGQQPKNSAEAMPPKPQQPSPHEDKRMRCTPEELYQLQYFHGSILENAEKKWNKKKTRVEVIFLQHGIKEEVEDMLREIEQMYKKTAEVSKTFESLETFCQQKRSHDLLCYITEDKKKIVIIGNDKRKVEKTEKECEDLLASETEIEVKSEEGASTLPVFVTNEGIFVYVYRDSLLKANVDAVLCPISKSFDLRGGLPKIIADMAGASYKKKVDEILIENGKLPEHFVCTIQGGEYLICKYVVNAVTTAYATYKPEESKKYLHHLLMGSFFEAEKVGAKSIALPAICSGKMGYPKEVCANCYASSVVKYSSGITSESQGLREIHFVDQSAEMITFIESVFSNPDMIEIVDLQEQRVTTDSSLYPTPIDETGSCWLNQYLSIQVVNTPISKLKSSPIATLVYDESLKLEKSAFEAFRSKFKSGKSKSKSQVGDIEIHQQHDLSKSFIKIMHVVLPTWSNKNPILDTFCKDLSLCFAKIFEKAIEESLFDLTLPLYGTVKGNAELTKRCATCLLNEVMKFGEKLLSFKKSCSILIANEDKSVHDIMFRELEGLVESEQAGFSTSRSFRRKSKARQLPITPLGDQPKGTIHSEHTKSSLKGFEDCGTIELHVRIPNGRQQGQNFVGRKETIYIPDNPMGVKVAKKLIAAFNLKILYTVKTQGASKVEMG
ncbi:uncharacterized protein LOC134265167 isoform X2 [Saccostrea cucullata]|uniref:uncharacterized protein LOC134265167 isoform X2 n=1 Tax=Saccostrea cuccullata TaxID=36930 RepID=UPI002ED50223